MASVLRIINPQATHPYPDEDLNAVILPPIIPPEQMQAQAKLELTAIIDEDEDMETWHAKMDSKKVVAKLIRIDQPSSNYPQCAFDNLKKESELFTTDLSKLQGDVVPRFFGLYSGNGEGTTVAACMVLEHYDEIVTCDIVESDIYK